jgi:diguanylate cyclase (GGDEF)-like protein
VAEPVAAAAEPVVHCSTGRWIHLLLHPADGLRVVHKADGTSELAGRRLFAVYATASLLPIVALGAVLSWLLGVQADRNGLIEARHQAGIAAVAMSPLLATADLHDLTPVQRLILGRTADFAAAQSQVLRVSVYSPDGHRVFQSDEPAMKHSSTESDEVSDEVKRALRGEVLAQLSHMDADAGGGGPRVVEVYQPVRATPASGPVGVVELYLPYEPIAAHAAEDRRTITRVLVGGLAALWLVLIAISISVTRRLRRQVRATTYLAAHDPLTSLPNRMSFRQQAACDLAESPSGTAVAVMDLDRFREVNDALGHRNGDELLEKLAVRLRAAVRPDDTVARLGGNEFGLVIRDVACPAEAEETLQRLRAVVSEGIVVGGLPLTVEASVGYALHPADSPDAHSPDTDALLRFADIAMSTAKRRRLGLARYDEADNPHDGTALTLMGELQRAVADDELVLHYQPKVHISTGRVEAVEALVRWQHPERGLLFPDAFIPAAEQTELMELLTTWVIGRSLDDLGRIDPSGTMRVAVNVSARSLARPDFAATLLALLAGHEVAPDRIVLEMTETALLIDPERVADALGELSRAGVRISIDDFGAGQTSLGYLATLPVDEVKIDKSFVLDMALNPRNAAIVRSVVELAHSLGFTTTAEGVETADALSDLRSMGCDAAQGYLLSRPVSLARLPSSLGEAARLAAIPVPR